MYVGGGEHGAPGRRHPVRRTHRRARGAGRSRTRATSCL